VSGTWLGFAMKQFCGHGLAGQDNARSRMQLRQEKGRPEAVAGWLMLGTRAGASRNCREVSIKAPRSGSLCPLAVFLLKHQEAEIPALW